MHNIWRPIVVASFQIAEPTGDRSQTDTSALTAIANDYGYDDVFSRQYGGPSQAGDVLLGISTSGNSGSILAACDVGVLPVVTSWV